MEKQKVVAVIGCGRLAKSAHLPALIKLPAVRVKYACDAIIEKAKALREEFPQIENTAADYRQVLADSEVDAVFIITPNHLHHTIAMAALAAGKHVFCEKPIAVNYQLACEMAQEANKRGLMLNIGVCNRYHKSVEMLAQMNAEGKFGNIYHVYCSFRSFRSIPGLGGAFTTKAKSGGGVLIDWGIHFFDLVLYILGGAKLCSVTGDAYCALARDMKSYKYKSMWAADTADIENGTNDVDDFITGHIRTDKASISFNGAWAQNIKKPEMFIDILGDKGGARLKYGGKFEFFDGQTLETEAPEYEIPNMYQREDAAFLESMETGVKNRCHIDNILESAKLLDMLYASAEAGKEIKL